MEKNHTIIDLINKNEPLEKFIFKEDGLFTIKATKGTEILIVKGNIKSVERIG